MKLIIGLGNPGKEYENTRHNIGFMVIDYYLNNVSIIPNNKQMNTKTIQDVINNFHNSTTWQKKFNALYTTLNINNEKVYFIKPQTYMNLSGDSIKEFVHYYKIDPKDILVIHDDLDLPIGKIRIKINSSAGGHNGVKSIIEKLGTNNFARLKIGIKNVINIDIKDYVLGTFNKEEMETLTKLFPKLIEIINSFLTKDIGKLMNDYNHNK